MTCILLHECCILHEKPLDCIAEFRKIILVVQAGTVCAGEISNDGSRTTVSINSKHYLDPKQPTFSRIYRRKP